MQLIELQVKRVKINGLIQTEFYQNGRLKAIIPTGQTQPRKGKRFITFNCFKFSLNWNTYANS